MSSELEARLGESSQEPRIGGAISPRADEPARASGSYEAPAVMGQTTPDRRDTVESLHDVTDAVKTEQLLTEQTRLLEMIAAGRPLRDCLSALCAVVPRLKPRTRASVLLADEARTRFERPVAPGMPPSFGDLLEGTQIGEAATGSCAVAVYCGEPVTCKDVVHDGHWSAGWRELCLAHGVRACHSAPAVDALGVPRASFMLCFDEPRELTSWEYRLADFGAHITSIAPIRERAERSLRESRAELAADLADAKLLQRISAQLVHQEDIEALYRAIVDAALTIMRSDYASMQVLHPERGEEGELHLLAHREFPREAAAFWEWVRPDSRSTCGIALRTRKRVVVPNVDESEAMAGSDDLAMCRKAGVRAAQSTPLIARGGQLLGMISTHWRAPHEPSERDFRLLDILVRQAADLVDRKRAELALEQARKNAEAQRARLAELVTTAERARDEAESARLEAQKANQAKSDFLAAMSHEFRTPLNAIAGYLQLIEMGIHGPITEEQRYALARARKSQQHLLSLINDVLNFAKLEAGRVEYSIEELPLRDVVFDVTTMIEPQLAAKNIAFVVSVDAGETVRADREKLQQILLNLLSNAAKFTDAGGWVRVSAAGCSDHPSEIVCLSVADNGCGIPADKLESIFDAFVQVNRRLTQTPEGTGLGLAISRDLARAMGGDLRVRSAEGAGATFTVVLPRAGTTSAEPVVETSSTPFA